MLDTRKADISGVTLTDQAYFSLRSDIVNGRLLPGFKLRVEYLKQLYGTGASPIREALTRLVGDGLVQMEQRRGFRVSHVSSAEIKDITDMRALLECYALRKSIADGDAQWERRIETSFQALSKLDARLLLANPGEEWELRHDDFHAALVSACPSPWLQNQRQNLFDQSERYRRIAWTTARKPRPVPEEHEAIKDAVLARDVDLACSLMQDHFKKTTQAVIASPLIED
jgi:DNA-binding GntR family transcriptional regulator